MEDIPRMRGFVQTLKDDWLIAVSVIVGVLIIGFALLQAAEAQVQRAAEEIVEEIEDRLVRDASKSYPAVCLLVIRPENRTEQQVVDCLIDPPRTESEIRAHYQEARQP